MLNNTWQFFIKQAKSITCVLIWVIFFILYSGCNTPATLLSQTSSNTLTSPISTVTNEFNLFYDESIVWNLPENCISLATNSLWRSYDCPDAVWLENNISLEKYQYDKSLFHLSFSPDNTYMVLFDSIGNIKIFDMTQLKSPIHEIQFPSVHSVLWSPDEAYLLVHHNNLTVFSIKDGYKTEISLDEFFIPGNLSISPAWSNDSQFIYFGWRSDWVLKNEALHQLWKFNVITAEKELLFETQENIGLEIASPLLNQQKKTLRMGSYVWYQNIQQLKYEPLPYIENSKKASNQGWSDDELWIWQIRDHNGSDEIVIYSVAQNQEQSIIFDGEKLRFVEWEHHMYRLWIEVSNPETFERYLTYIVLK